jgi:hypothetical protein
MGSVVIPMALLAAAMPADRLLDVAAVPKKKYFLNDQNMVAQPEPTHLFFPPSSVYESCGHAQKLRSNSGTSIRWARNKQEGIV